MSSLYKDLDKFTPRQEQIDCIKFIDEQYKSDKESKFFLLNLPVGIGKSHLALMIANWVLKNVSNSTRFDIITNSKILQDQYSNTYKSINDLKGKENYECESYSCSCAQGQEFNRLNKTSCESCPFSNARESFLSGKISLTNFYLYILYSIYNTKLLENRGSKVLIVDECHDLEDVVSDFISIRITENIIKKFKFSNENQIIKKFKYVQNIEDYLEFLNYLLEEIISTINDIESGMVSTPRSEKSDKRDLRISKVLKSKNSDVKLMQIIADLKQYQTKIEVFLKEYKENPNNWVLETSYNQKTKSRELSLEPIWAFDYMEKYIFSRYDMVFLMSGTILDKELFCYLNGLDSKKAVYYSIESPFPLENRPFYYMPIGKMSFKNKEETFKKYIPYIKKILNKYNNKKGIIHTNSFELASWIQESIKDKRLLFHDSSNKDEVLKLHYESKDPTVIVSPSMDTGVSFDDDKARFQIIAKVPYPSLASQKNKLRQKNNPEWYAYKTVSGIIQCYGRIIRSIDDHGDTIMIDGSFSDVLKHSSYYIPDWVQKSIKRIEIKRDTTQA